MRDTINVTSFAGAASVEQAFTEALELAKRRGITELAQVSLYARTVETLGGKSITYGWDLTVEGSPAAEVEESEIAGDLAAYKGLAPELREMAAESLREATDAEG